MGTKRSADEIENALLRSHTQLPKKARLSPSAREPLNSSEPSSRSVSEDSALQSSPGISAHARQSSISSIESAYEDEASASSSESSSESNEDSSSEENEEEDGTKDANGTDEIKTIGGPKKPSMTMKGAQKAKMRDLHGKLENMLLQLAQANEELEEDAEAYNMENVEEDEPHIEMNLGLGVLEELAAEVSSSEDESGENGDSCLLDENEEDDEGYARRTLPSKGAKPDTMSKLLGRDANQQKANIEILG